MREYLIGSYAPTGCDSIFRVCLNEKDLRIDCIASWACAENPSYLMMHPNGKILYAVEERIPDGGLVVLRMEGNRLVRLASLPSGGGAPCHLAMDDAGRYLFISNYMSGSLAVYALDDTGMPVEMTDLIQHRGCGINPQRQEGPHIHSAWYHRSFVYVCDLGLDTVFCYHLDAQKGKLSSIGRNISLPAGSGPRHSCHMPQHPNLLYINCELSGDVFVWDIERHALVQRISALPEGQTEGWVSAIKAENDMLYVANRGVDCFAAFKICRDGTLKAPYISRHAYQTCRDFHLEDGYAVSADQDSRHLSILLCDAEGRMKAMNTCPLPAAQPTFILPLQ